MQRNIALPGMDPIKAVGCIWRLSIKLLTQPIVAPLHFRLPRARETDHFRTGWSISVHLHSGAYTNDKALRGKNLLRQITFRRVNLKIWLETRR